MNLSLPITRRTALAVAALASTALVAACGSSPSNSTTTTLGSTPSTTSSYGPAATGPHNSADVAFATDMIPHHAQAVEMATMALSQGTNTQVKTLATAIKGAQDPEINTMSGWLVGWGKKVPAGSSMTGMTGMGGSGTSMNGMMSDAEMSQLRQASGAAFDRLWVQMMTKHHQGAVQMANTELSMGQNTDAKALATRIIRAQTAEIATMTALAKTLPA
jgi:uncharacterized protein (DUF305 family)